MIKVEKLKKCRICGNPDLFSVVTLGNQYVSAVFPDSLDYKFKLEQLPLNLVMCQKNDNSCGTVQLDHIYDLTDMYKNYPYTSATNRAMLPILEDVANSARKLVDIKEEDLILSIGENDCSLLSFFDKDGCDLLAIDAAQVEQVFNSPKLTNIQGKYFDYNVFLEGNKGKKSKVIFSVAMFYHLNNPIQFLIDVEKCLSDDGIFIVQMAYLCPMLKTNMLDNILAEHAAYYSFNNLQWMAEKAGLEIFHGEENNVYGGSMRVFFKKKGNNKHKITPEYQQILDKEVKEGIFTLSPYKEFEYRIDQQKKNLVDLLIKIKNNNKKVMVYGASSKGNSILQFCGIRNDLIQYAADVAKWKIGKYMVGSDVFIISQEEMRAARPDYLLSLSYSFTEQFKKQEHELVENGTKFIVPLPEVGIYN